MDLTVLLWIQSHLRCDFLDHFFIFITKSGDGAAVWIALAAVLLTRRDTRRSGIYVTLALILSALLTNFAVKPLFDRPRPFESYALVPLVPPPMGSSFPSAHSAVSFACATAYFISTQNRLRWVTLVLACLIAFSRLYVFVHYPTDVTAGILLGIVFGFLAKILGKKLTDYYYHQQRKGEST